MKKIIIISVISILSVMILAFAAGYITVDKDTVPPLNSYQGEVKALTETFPSDIMVYGEDVDFGNKIIARKICDFKEETLMQNKDCRFRFLVINDRSGNVNLPVEDYKNLNEIILKNDISLYYVGISEVDKMIQAGIVDQLGSDEMLGFGNHIFSSGDRVIAVGFWTKKSEKIYQEKLSSKSFSIFDNEIDLLGESLLEEFVSIVKRFPI